VTDAETAPRIDVGALAASLYCEATDRVEKLLRLVKKNDA